MIGKDLSEAVRFLQNGEVVGIPTETVYGLAANALDTDAVIKIFQAKNRPSFDPLIVHIGDPSDLDKYVSYIPPKAQGLINAFWPGPLTLVLPKRDLIPDLVTSGLSHVAVRMPVHPMTRQLLGMLDFPLAAPSANPFGYISPTEASHVEAQLGKKVPYILDGGPSTVGVESTIVGFENDQPVVLRFGGIPVEEIEKVVGKTEIRTQGGDNPQAPGQLSSHYASTTPLILTEDIDKTISEHPGKSVILLTHSPVEDSHGLDRIDLSGDGSLESIAKNLFRVMRKTDELGYDLILVKPVAEKGLGRAINDRLYRAGQPK